MRQRNYRTAGSVALLIAIGGCGICGVEQRTDVLSPDRVLTATVFERNCGATTDYTTAISIRETGAAFSGQRWDDVFRMKGLPRVSVTWSSPTELVIKRPALKDEIFLEESRWKHDVRITYIDAEIPSPRPWAQPTTSPNPEMEIPR
jgi:hypothetical protein